MKRREFVAVFSAAAAWLLSRRARAQMPPGTPPAVVAPSGIGQVATLHGTATVTRDNAAPAALKIADAIFENDRLETAPESTLGVTFDDQTTFSLSANTRIVVDRFVYRDSGNANAASFNVALGTAAFVASLVAKTGDMQIVTPQATLGIRGTTGVVEVPPAGTAAAAPTIKLYPDTDGHVGRIEVFDRQGGQLGILTRGASAFAIRRGAAGRFAAVPYQIPPLEAARDRGVLQRLGVSHTIGRQMTIQRRLLRAPDRLRGNGVPQAPRGRPNDARPPGAMQPRQPRPRRGNPFSPNKRR